MILSLVVDNVMCLPVGFKRLLRSEGMQSTCYPIIHIRSGMAYFQLLIERHCFFARDLSSILVCLLNPIDDTGSLYVITVTHSHNTNMDAHILQYHKRRQPILNSSLFVLIILAMRFTYCLNSICNAVHDKDPS